MKPTRFHIILNKIRGSEKKRKDNDIVVKVVLHVGVRDFLPGAGAVIH